jgi:hypothetical protein
MNMPMRDISSDLQAILAVLDEEERAEDARHSKAHADIAQKRATVQATLDLQTSLLANVREKVLDAKPLRPGAQTRLESEILDVLSNAREWEHTEIKAELISRGIGVADDPNFGRGLQGTLLSMRGRELVDLAGMRKWRITAKGLGRELPIRRRPVLGTPSQTS